MYKNRENKINLISNFFKRNQYKLLLRPQYREKFNERISLKFIFDIEKFLFVLVLFINFYNLLLTPENR